MKIRDLIKLVEADGWRHVETKGSQPGRVTIPGHPGDDIHPGTLKSVLAQAGLKGKVS